MSKVEYYKRWGKSSLSRNTPLRPFGKKRKRRAKGRSQIDVFKQIWDERPHQCEQCGSPIREFNIKNFAHIYPKGSYPGIALGPRNIALACGQCHRADHNDPDFEWAEHIQRRADKAKREYYNQK